MQGILFLQYALGQAFSIGKKFEPPRGDDVSPAVIAHLVLGLRVSCQWSTGYFCLPPQKILYRPYKMHAWRHQSWAPAASLALTRSGREGKKVTRDTMPGFFLKTRCRVTRCSHIPLPVSRLSSPAPDSCLSSSLQSSDARKKVEQHRGDTGRKQHDAVTLTFLKK